METKPFRGLWCNSSELPEVKAQLRSKIPKISYFELRRSKLPIYEAIIKELLEEGYEKSADIIEALVATEKRLLDTHVIENKLSNCTGLLSAIVDNCKITEWLILKEDRNECLNCLFQTAFLTELKNSDYYWLAQELYSLMINMLDEFGHGNEFNFIESKIRFHYGKFLFEKVHSNVEAIEQLKIAAELSNGNCWYDSFDKPTNYYFNSTQLLCEALLAEANKVYYINPELAEIYAFQAVQGLKTSCICLDSEFYCQVALKYSELMMILNKHEKALKFLNKVQPHINVMSDPKYKCELFFQQGVCYFWICDQEMSFRKLKQSIRLGEIHKLLTIKAQALVQIGKLYSKDKKTFSKAQMAYTSAKETFIKLNDFKNIKKVNYSMAILKSQEILPRLINLIVQSETNDTDMEKLRSWKDISKPFWNREESSSLTELTWCESEDSEVGNNVSENTNLIN